MNSLLKSLRIIDTSLLDDNYDIFLNSNNSKEYYSMILTIIEYANNYLINDNGECMWDNIHIITHNGFNVFPGDRDRFGWLTGCIQTKKGIIMYG